MAAAIFFVSGGPLVWGPSLFLCPRGGVRVWGFGFSVGVLGSTQKSQSYKAPGIFTPV